MSKRSTIAEPAIFCWSNHCLPLSPRWWWVWSSKTEVLNLPLLPAETWSFNRDSLRDSTRRNSRGSKTSDATEELAQLNWDVFGATFVSRWWFQRVLCFQCVFYLLYVFLGNDPKIWPPKNFQVGNCFHHPPTTCKRYAYRSSKRRSCLAAILRQRCCPKGERCDVMGESMQLQMGGKWTGQRFFFWFFFLGGGGGKFSSFWFQLWGSATHGWVGLVHDIFQMQLQWSTKIVCQVSKDFQRLNRPMVNWRLVVPVSSQRLLGFLVTPHWPHTVCSGPPRFLVFTRRSFMMMMLRQISHRNIRGLFSRSQNGTPIEEPEVFNHPFQIWSDIQ